MKRLPTVKVNRGGVPVIINESAFDPNKDKLWKGKEPAPKPPGKPMAEIVQHKGGWYTVEVDGEVISDGKVRKEEAEQIQAAHNED